MLGGVRGGGSSRGRREGWLLLRDRPAYRAGSYSFDWQLRAVTLRIPQMYAEKTYIWIMARTLLKDERLHLRLTSAQRTRIDRAAEAEGRTISRGQLRQCAPRS